MTKCMALALMLFLMTYILFHSLGSPVKLSMLRMTLSKKNWECTHQHQQTVQVITSHIASAQGAYLKPYFLLF